MIFAILSALEKEFTNTRAATHLSTQQYGTGLALCADGGGPGRVGGAARQDAAVERLEHGELATARVSEDAGACTR